jgi:2-succinyl-6-hydroxy-2,4-cyclohexadiene-1-carboxylate synthase
VEHATPGDAERARISAGELSLGVVSRGAPASPPVIVLHGFTGSAESMEGVARALASDCRVHALELVGHGASDAPDDVAAYAMDRCADQVVAAMDALGIRQGHFVGYSMGARAALSLAIRAPHRVGSLALIGVSPGFVDESERSERIAADRSLAEQILSGGIEAFVDRWMALPLFASQERLGAEALAQARAQRLAANPVGLANSLRGMGTGAMPPLWPVLPELDLPVLLVVGREDEKFSALANRLLGSFPQAELLEIAEAGHAAHLERPQAFEAGYRQFLRSVLHAGGETKL